MSDRESIAMLVRALAQIQADLEAGFKRQQVQTPVVRNILGVIGEVLRDLRDAQRQPEGAPADDERAEIERRVEFLLARIDPEALADLAASEEAAGRDAGWLRAALAERPPVAPSEVVLDSPPPAEAESPQG